MKKLKYTIFIIIIILSLSSCMEAFYTLAFPKKPHPVKFENYKNGDRQEIVIVPMLHIAKPNFYKESKSIIKKLRKENYTIYYERVKYPEKIDSLQLDMLRRKMRKLVGVPFGFKLTDKSFADAYPKFFSSGRYIQQNPVNSGYSYNLDQNVDFNVIEMLNAYEKKFGEIKLTECDLKTDFDDKYWCDKLDNKDYVIKKLREDFVIKKVMNSDKQKIGLIYGKIHLKGFKERLKNLGFKKVEY